MTAKSLLLGAGNDRRKKVALESAPNWFGELVTVDMNPDCGANVVWDLDVRPLPFEDEEFDELAAYDVLEHLGRQGDWRGFLDEFSEYWRILKPGGIFGILVPIGRDSLADPGHTRFFDASYFRFLDQEWYAQELAAKRAVTDYRWYYKRSFKTRVLQVIGDHHLGVVLEKV